MMVEWHYFPGGFRICRKHNLKVCVECSPKEMKVKTFEVDGNMGKSGKVKNVKQSTDRLPMIKNKKVSKKGQKPSVATGGVSVVNNVIFERFHNYRVRFDAKVDWDLLNVPAKKLSKNNYYKQLEFDKSLVQVFSKSILVILRRSAEIVGLDVRSAKARADIIIWDVVSRLPKCIIVDNAVVKSLHNAFVNHPIGEYDINVQVDGETRVIADNSKGNPELETVHPKFAISDSIALRSDIRELVDRGLSRGVLAGFIDDLVKDRQFHAENIRSHIGAIQDLASSVKRLTDVIERLEKR